MKTKNISKAKAEELLDYMREIINIFGRFSVADYKSFFGLKMVHKDIYLGWYSADEVKIIPTKNGCFVSFPEPIKKVKGENTNEH